MTRAQFLLEVEQRYHELNPNALPLYGALPTGFFLSLLQLFLGLFGNGCGVNPQPQPTNGQALLDAANRAWRPKSRRYQGLTFIGAWRGTLREMDERRTVHALLEAKRITRAYFDVARQHTAAELDEALAE